MTSTVVRTQEQDRPQLPHVEVADLDSKPEKYIPPTRILSVRDTTMPTEPDKRLLVYMEDEYNDESLIVDLLTNNDAFHFVMQFIRSRKEFDRFCVVESMPVDTPF